jgi:hypothetical protein
MSTRDDEIRQARPAQGPTASRPAASRAGAVHAVAVMIVVTAPVGRNGLAG